MVAVAPPASRADHVPEGDVGQPGRSLPRGVAVALTVLAMLIVWIALVAPDHPSRLTLGAFARLPSSSSS